jgi:hypothetical protein
MRQRISLQVLAMVSMAALAVPAGLADEIPAQACTGMDCLPDQAKPADLCKGVDCNPPTPATQCSGLDYQPIADRVTPTPEDEKVAPPEDNKPSPPEDKKVEPDRQ